MKSVHNESTALLDRNYAIIKIQNHMLVLYNSKFRSCNVNVAFKNTLSKQ